MTPADQSTFKTVIIDDEAAAQRVLQNLISEYCPQLEVVAIAGDVPSAVIAINKHQPDVVFLDIEMPNYTGLQLLDFFEEPEFEIIFATAYSEYAAQAFRVSAIDYLLKPIQIDHLKKAVEKLEKARPANSMPDRLETLRTNLREEYITRVALPISEGLMFVDVADIICLEADKAYTHIFLSNRNKLLVSKNLRELEKILTHPCFFRTHRSFLINLNHVSRYVRKDGGYIVMDNEQVASLSQSRREDFLKAYQEK